MKKAIKYVLIGLGVITIIGIIGQAFDKPQVKSKTAEPVATEAATTTTEKPEIPSTPESQWKYAENVDQMDNTTTKTATVNAINDLEFDFPYGRSSFSLTVRKGPKGTDVYLYCTSCQFMTGISGDESYRVKFDDEKPFHATVLGSESYDTKLAFLQPEAKLIEKLKKAKKIVVEPKFHPDGRRTVEFNVEGLKWN